MSKIKLNTKEFSTMLSKVAKGSAKGGFDLTAELVEIKLSNGTLSLRTTDSRNTMILRKSGVEGDDFCACIKIDVFEKVVNKTSKEEIELKVDSNVVELVGNGTYKFAIAIEGDQAVTFSPISLIQNPEISCELKLDDIRRVIKCNGDFVGSPFIDPTISGYYFSDYIITTDGMACCFYHKRFFDTPVMLYPTTLQLLNEFEDDVVHFLKKDNKIQFYSNTGLINSVSHTSSDDFPENELKDYLSTAFRSSVNISRKATESILERICLFVDMKADYGATIFSFESDGIHITDKKKTASEVLPYTNAVNFQNFSCYMPAADLMRILSVEGADDEITLWYGSDNAVKLEIADVTRILALLDDDSFDSSELASIDDSDNSISDDMDTIDINLSEEAIGSLEDIQW